MPDWPRTIPYDLRETLEAADHDAWRPAFQSWAKTHQLRFKLQWEVDLMRRVGQLHQYRWAPMIQDRWTAIREWLVAHDVPVPDRLPVKYPSVRKQERSSAYTASVLKTAETS